MSTVDLTAAPISPRPGVLRNNTTRLRVWLAELILLMLVLGFQINVIEDVAVKVTYDVVVAGFIFLLLANHLTTRFAVCIAVFALVGVAFGDLIKWFYLSLAFYFGFIFIARYGARVGGFVDKLVGINLALVVIQVLGVTQLVYLFQNYYLPDQFVNLLLTYGPVDFFPLMQLRPSGLFPSTIYLSVFQFFLVTYVFLYQSAVTKRLSFFMALFFTLTGSTTCVLLALGVLLLAENRTAARQFFKYFVICMLLYAALLPALFFEVNYSFFSLLTSVDSRLFLDPEAGENLHSAFARRPVLFAAFVAAVSVYLRYGWDVDVRKLAFVALLVFGPLMLHDALTSVFYWFDVGCIYGIVVSRRWRRGAARQRVLFSPSAPVAAA